MRRGWIGPFLLIGLGVALLVDQLAPRRTDLTAGGLLLLFGVLLLLDRMLRRGDGGRRRPVFGPLLLIAAGVLWGAHALVPAAVEADWVARVWPAFLIVWGGVRLLEYLLAPAETRPRGLGGGEIFLVIFVLLAGGIFTGVWATHRQWGGAWHDWANWNWDWNGPRYSFQANASTALKPGQAVQTIVADGSVTVTPGTDATLHLLGNDSISAPNRQAAQARFQNTQPAFLPQPAGAFATSETAPESWARGASGILKVEPLGANYRRSSPWSIRTDLQLTLPAATALMVQTRNGSIAVAHWKAPLALMARDGDVTVNGAGASTAIRLNGGDVAVRDAEGAVAIAGRSGGDLHLARVRGPVSVKGDFAGSFTARSLSQGFFYRSHRAQIAVAALPGQINMDLDHLEMHNGRQLQVKTRDQTIVVEEARGATSIDDRDDAVQLTQLDSAPVAVRTRNGDIRVELPADAHFTVSAEARRGTIRSDFPLSVAAHGATVRATGTIGGGGPMLDLHTTNGAIALAKLAAPR